MNRREIGERAIDRVLQTITLLVAAFVAVGVAFTVLIPVMQRTGHTLVSSADVASDRRATSIEIIQSWGQVGGSQADVWVKNVGRTRIIALEKTDLFFGVGTAITGVPYGGSGCSAPCWHYELENDTAWNPEATLHITLLPTDPLVAATIYQIKIVTPNGVEATAYLAMPNRTWYLHNNPTPPTGDTTSQAVLPLDQTLPTAATLFNYDSDRDGAAGLLIAKGGSGPAESDPTKHQAWRTVALADDLAIQGDVSVILWSGIKSFDLGKAGSVTVFLRHFDGSTYTEIAQGSLTDSDWQGGSSTWVSKAINIIGVSYTIPAGEFFEVKLIVGLSAGDDMWFAYDTALYISRTTLP